ncbi:MAG: 4Fe-4S dicluster domain-containing protein [bacterium]|nr:4Fe-4S dicluster domain-containing protein [bacterium]
MKRRDFFKLMGIASGAALSACKVSNADKKLLPYLVPPEDGIIPGIPRYARSTCMECPAQCGINIKIREDKPVKLEGNPDHPVNKGALCMRGQASLARLYHPDRFKEPMLKGADGTFKPVSWEEAGKAFHAALKDSQGLRNIFLSSRTTGSLSLLIDEFCKALEMERAKEFEIFNHGAVKTANQRLFGLDRVPYYHMNKCDVLVTVGADILDTYISPVEWSRLYAESRKKDDFQWLHVEPYLTLTGAAADRRAVVKPERESYLLAYLLRNVTLRNPLPESLLANANIPEHTIEQVIELTDLTKEDILSITKALEQAKQPLLICGGPATSVHNGLVTAQYTVLLQWGLGMINNTVDFSASLNDETVGKTNDLVDLTRACKDGKVGVLLFSRIPNMDVVLPALNLLNKSRFKVALAGMPDAVTDTCDLVLPLSNPLESWGDAEPRKGIKSVIQPVIKPLQNTKSEGDILIALLGRDQNYHAYLAEQWLGMDETWIDKGFKAIEPEAVTVRLAPDAPVAEPVKRVERPNAFIKPSLRTYDGRSRGTTILEEIPEPLTTVTYGKYITLSPGEARKRGLSPGEIVEVSSLGGELELPILISPAAAGGLMTIGIDAVTGFSLPVDSSFGEFLLLMEDVKLTITGKKIKIPVLSGGLTAGKRGIIPSLEKKDELGHVHKYKRHTLYEPHDHKNYRWGMVIDLDACTGCSACVAACYIENNIPVVGKDEHLRGREMAWLRIEPYFNDGNQPEFLPMMCQQCDCAPCETVCPVFATYHNEEGLNAQVYNRCVGTRYCANNCPYKARRFNWFDHSRSLPLYDVSNPDLSVRPGGVMEKCTFCFQRIRYAKDRAKDEKRLVKDGEVIPACAQTCPAGAVTFGNLMDPDSKVSKLAKSAGAYRVQEPLGTEPAVYYIKRKK